MDTRESEREIGERRGKRDIEIGEGKEREREIEREIGEGKEKELDRERERECWCEGMRTVWRR